MSKVETINWKTFKDTLLKYPEYNLQFKYAEGKLVDAAYHITEIKQAPITAVDCGGMVNTWTEIIIQLWEPENDQRSPVMKIAKALSIIDIVESKLPLNINAMVKIEFGNSEFDARQMFPGEIIISGENLVVDLRADQVQCKAIDRGGSCGTNERSEAGLKNLAVANSNCCSPDSVCC